MLFSVTPFGRQRVAVLAILIVFAMEQSLTTCKTIASTFLTPTEKFKGTWVIASQLQRYQKGIRNLEVRTNLKDIEDATPPLHHTSFLKIARGGGTSWESDSAPDEDNLSMIDERETEKRSLDNIDYELVRDRVASGEATIVTIGAIDLSGVGSNSPSTCSSIVLVVDDENRNDAITVDETLLEKTISTLFQDKSRDSPIEKSSEDIEEDIKTVLESLSLLCDVTVVRIGKEEALAPEIISCVMRGDQQRKTAGMAGGRLWLYATEGNGHRLRRLICNSDDGEDDNRCHSSMTTWSTLFSSSIGEHKNDGNANEVFGPSLKELFTSLSQQVIRSKQRSTPKLEETATESFVENAYGKLFPTVAVLCISKNGHRTLQSSQIKQASFSNGKESKNVKESLKTVSMSDKTSDKSRMGIASEQQDDGEIVRDVIGMAYRQLENLQEKMQELVLDQASNPMPLLEFGNVAQDILQTADTRLKDEIEMHDSFRRGLTKGIVTEVQRLYKDQLQALRNYYGQRYESILDEELEDDIHNDETIERKWAIGAEHMTQAFLAAALNAVPVMYRTNLKSTNDGIKEGTQTLFSHVDALQGLVQDMIESTERRQDEKNVSRMLDENEEEKSGDNPSTSSRIFRLPNLPKWLERLAARAFVFGVNYVQGWLAWQGIKRAALERDRNQPKFPLF